MPTITLTAQQLNDLRQTALVACDAAYAGDARPVGSPLSGYVDGNTQPIPFVHRQGFTVAKVLTNSQTGLKVSIYKHATSNELIVAFAGTDGPNVTDWYSNAFHLGLNQWSEAARVQIFGEIDRLA